MKRRESQRISKRDGRTEWLRVTKLARSIGRAIAAARGIDFDTFHAEIGGEAWRTLELASAVLTGLRQANSAGATLTTSQLAEAVQRVLLANDLVGAAQAYTRVSGQQLRRRAVLDATMPSLQHGLSLLGLDGLGFDSVSPTQPSSPRSTLRRSSLDRRPGRTGPRRRP